MGEPVPSTHSAHSLWLKNGLMDPEKGVDMVRTISRWDNSKQPRSINLLGVLVLALLVVLPDQTYARGTQAGICNSHGDVIQLNTFSKAFKTAYVNT